MSLTEARSMYIIRLNFLKILLHLSKYLFAVQHKASKVSAINSTLSKLLRHIENYAINFSKNLKPFPIKAINKEIEIHTLLTSRDVCMYLWAIRSLLYFSNLKCQVVVHDDGRLTESDYHLLKTSLPSIKIYSRDESDLIVKEKLQDFANCLSYREQNILTLKIFDFNLLSTSNKILSFDSDILFFRKPNELLNSIYEDQYSIAYNREYENPSYVSNPTLSASFPSVLAGFNSGLMCYQRQSFSIQEIAEIVDWVFSNSQSLSRLDEQVIYAILSGSKDAHALSNLYCADAKPKVRRNRLVCRHYHTCLRYAFALEGIRELLRESPEFISCCVSKLH